MASLLVGQRVLDAEENCPNIEVSIPGAGNFKGIEVKEVWTYFSRRRNDGGSIVVVVIIVTPEAERMVRTVVNVKARLTILGFN